MPANSATQRLLPALQGRSRRALPIRACISCGQRATTGNRCASPDCAKPEPHTSPSFRLERDHLLHTQKTCWICGGFGRADDPLTADHLHPLAHGGHVDGELRAAHRSCNSRRGATQAPRKIARSPRAAYPGGRENR